MTAAAFGDIDALLLNVVTESVGVAKRCQARIGSVGSALEQAQGQVDVESSVVPVPSETAEFDVSEEHPNHPANLDNDDDLPYRCEITV